MKYALTVFIMTVFSMIGTSFAIIPVYYSEDKCDMDKDLQNYHEILQDDVIVKTFMEKYPSAISIPATGIDDSDPPQTSVHYLYEDDATRTQLTLRILGYNFTDSNDCFVPFSYTLNYQNNTKTIQIINYEKNTRELVDFLKELVPTIPITQNDILTNYENSDLILEGKVISLDRMINQTRYDVEVEHYYKGRLSSKMITVFESTEKPSFEKDNRVVLYIQQKDRYLIQAPSFKVDYECDSGRWGSFLAPKYEDILVRGVPASGNFPEFSEPDSTSGLYLAGKEMKITYSVENYGPMIKHATVKITIFSKQKTVFSDQRSITVPACSGRVPLSWNFIPESGDHTVHVTVSGTYEVDDKSFQFQEPKMISDFEARENWAGGSLDRTVYSDYFSNDEYSIYSLKYKHHEYFVPYRVSDANLEKMELSCETSSLLVHLQNAKNGSLTVNLGRKMLSSQAGEGDFIILVDNEEAHFKEIDSNSDSRTLEISFGKDVKLIEIIVTQWVTQMPYPKTCGIAESEESQYYKLLSPLEQYNNGIEASQVKCKEDFILLKKAHNGSPICVRIETGQKLLDRKLAQPTIFGISSESLPMPENLVDVEQDHISKIILPLGLASSSSQITPEPQSITLVIGVNNTVLWENQGSTAMTIVSDVSYDAWTTGMIKPGQSKIMIFNDTGIHRYHGTPGPWITGTITVKEK